MSRAALIGLGLGLAATPAAAMELRLPVGGSDGLLEEARDARARSELALAESLLAEAAKRGSVPAAALKHERGLLARDAGDSEGALALLRQAADADPSSSARVDQAGVLVGLGRWPEAVTVLRQAFEERAGGLPADTVTSDPRFARLQSFEPFRELVDRVREDQAGPWAKLVMRLQSLDDTASELQAQVERASEIMDSVVALLSSRWVAVLSLILIATLIGSAISQLKLLQPPWTLAAGTLSASVVWHFGALIATFGESDGLGTVAWALGIVFVPMGLGIAWRKWRR